MCTGDGAIHDLEDLQAHPSVGKQAPKPKAAGTFDWAKQWYPLVPEGYLDRRRPFPITVLGFRFVVWWDALEAAWRCFEDKCPHRLAPLSEGRIDPATQRLQCSYHGWQFAGDGRCTAVPQADSERQLEVACSSRRSCVAAYPVRLQQGLLWVWMDASPKAAGESAERAVALPSELADGSGLLLGDWYMRELPVSYDSLVENLMDPSHIHFSHHNVIGSRDRGGPLKIEIEGEENAQGGFTLLFQQKGVTFATAFQPPAFAWLQPNRRATKWLSLVFYAVPVTPGNSRIVAGYSTNALPPRAKRVLQSGPGAALMRSMQWFVDLRTHEVLDGDTLFIRDQVREYHCRCAACKGCGRGSASGEQAALVDGRGWKASYFIPAGADRGVATFRRWLERAGGGGPAYGPYGTALKVLPPMSREQILDRYEQHTKYCPSCRRALACVRGLQRALSFAATAGTAAAISLALGLGGPGIAPAHPPAAVPAGLATPQLSSFLAVLGSPGWGGLLQGTAAAVASPPFLLAAGAAACGLLRRWLGRLEARFVFTDYHHWRK